jgi:GTPase SAR1 family protein
VIIIGDEKVGKSNLLLRIVKNEFKRRPKQTYGVEFDFKTIKLP